MKMFINAPQEHSVWQVIFLQSKANGAHYDGEDLPELKWNWPEDTYFRRRLYHLREEVRLGPVNSYP